MPDDVITPEGAENIAKGLCCSLLPITAFTAQQIVMEFLAGYMLGNDPAALGFKFRSRYSADPTKSDISMQIAHDYKAGTASKKPAITIQRGDMAVLNKIIGQSVGRDPRTSDNYIHGINEVPITVVVEADPLGVAEDLAEWLKQGLVMYQQTLQNEFGFRRFRVTSVSRPQKSVEAKDYFAILIGIDLAFDEGYGVHQESLKLKTVSRTIYDRLTGQVFEP